MDSINQTIPHAQKASKTKEVPSVGVQRSADAPLNQKSTTSSHREAACDAAARVWRKKHHTPLRRACSGIEKQGQSASQDPHFDRGGLEECNECLMVSGQAACRITHSPNPTCQEAILRRDGKRGDGASPSIKPQHHLQPGATFPQAGQINA
jgi:hypothetical protein